MNLGFNKYSLVQDFSKGHEKQILKLRFSGDAIVSAGSDGLVKFWDIRQNDSVQEFSMGLENSINAADIHPEMFVIGW
jgi:WD40 repeat protein